MRFYNPRQMWVQYTNEWALIGEWSLEGIGKSIMWLLSSCTNNSLRLTVMGVLAP